MNSILKKVYSILVLLILSLTLSMKSQANSFTSPGRDDSGETVKTASDPAEIKNDFSGWSLIFLKYGAIPKKLTLSLIGEFRSYNNLSTFDMAHGILTVDYHVCKYFTVGAGYHFFGNRNPVTNEYFYMHGPEISAMGIYPLRDFTFILFERLDLFFLPDALGVIHKDLQIRNLLMVKYHIPNTIVSPLISIEPFVQLNDTPKLKAGAVPEIRYMIGADFKFDRHNTLGIKGILVNKEAVNPTLFRYVLEIDYIFSF